MALKRSKTIFSKIPFIANGEKEGDTENKRRSYWLEKLHGQKEQIRTDNNRREAQSKLARGRLAINEQIAVDKDPIQSGINENTKNVATKKEADAKIVDDLVRKSNRLIIGISSIFPWDLFPTNIEVEESRVTFHFNQLFSSQSHSVDMKDISNIFIETSFFFATLQVVSRTYIQNDIKIGNLNKEKARKVQKIIEGLRTFAEHDIDTSNYEIDELISKIDELQTDNSTS